LIVREVVVIVGTDLPAKEIGGGSLTRSCDGGPLPFCAAHGSSDFPIRLDSRVARGGFLPRWPRCDPFENKRFVPSPRVRRDHDAGREAAVADQSPKRHP
jgi:hypothetical protein